MEEAGGGPAANASHTHTRTHTQARVQEKKLLWCGGAGVCSVGEEQLPMHSRVSVSLYTCLFVCVSLSRCAPVSVCLLVTA